jgi:23S rRNA G2069 N7-methylase RlmK/C1962 C5-methylase RlmI
MLANRLRKNLARLGPWARREQLDAWRLYDRDIPEIPWAIDRYGGRALATEYVTPVGRRLDEAAREKERAEVIAATAEVLAIPPSAVALRTRERHRSVEREAQGSPAHEFLIQEGKARLLVNLDDYLDTGLFLDHREARKRVAGQASGKSLLNLFCYTGSFSVQAGLAGARRTVSVDLSAAYLAWTERNLRLNSLAPEAHATVRSDVFEYLAAATETFDLIVLDPPTVSRSARGKSFEIQRAHVDLIRRSMTRLTRGGALLFSTNDRSFQLEAGALQQFDCVEISEQTQGRDFRERLHRSWEIRERARS